jgi:hypothetical protein
MLITSSRTNYTFYRKTPKTVKENQILVISQHILMGLLFNRNRNNSHATRVSMGFVGSSYDGEKL